MQLGDILDDCTLDLVTGSIEIERVDVDSRECEPGSLFFAMPGHARSGEQFVDEAIARGAACVVASRSINVGVPVVVVPTSQMHALLAHASASITGHPELGVQLVGVTGTNGKTSVTSLVSSLARSLKWNSASMGTLTNERTTPAPPELFRTLAGIVRGYDPAIHHSVVALEVSSHAIDQRRIEGIRFATVAFTNLSHDHLDYHHTMEEYFNAKAELFTVEHAQRAVIWTDDPFGVRIAAMTRLPVTSVSRDDVTEVELSLSGSTYFWRGHLVSTPLVGGYNVDNAVMAMTILSVLGANDADIASAMSDVTSVSGRFDVVRDSGITVVVDYAHTPEGLRRLLGDIRELSPLGRIITVFGCGGDRDTEKRPTMGRVATTLSAVTIVTSDNPRSESPEAIIDDIMGGVVQDATVLRIVDRRGAIAQAFAIAHDGDVIVLAGKGHETTQIIGGSVLDFDDRVVAKEFLK